MKHRILSLLLLAFTAIAYSQPVATAGSTVAICATSPAQISVTASGGIAPYTYAWSPATTLNDPTLPNPLAFPLVTTTYTVTVTDAATLTATASMQVIVNPKPSASIGASDPQLICAGSVVDIIASTPNPTCGPASAGGNNFLGVVGNGSILQSGNSVQLPGMFSNINNSLRQQMLYSYGDINALANGHKVIKSIAFNLGQFNSNATLQNVVVKIGCTSQTSLSTWETGLTTVFTSATFTPVNGWNTINLQTPYMWAYSNLVVEICTYNPSTFGNQVNKAQCTNTLNNTYLYQGANNDLCTTPGVPTVSQLRPNIRFMFANEANPILYSYEWQSVGNTTYDTITERRILATINDTCTYSVIITNNYGCTDTAFVTIEPDLNRTAPVIDSLVTTHATCGLGNGSILAYTTACNQLTYSWNNGSTANPNTMLWPETYGLTVVDCNNCQATDYATVTATPVLNLSFVTNNVTCFGAANGSIDLTVTGGTAPYTYQWSFGNTIEDLNNLPAGAYIIIVTDAVGCTITDTVQISEPLMLTIDSSGSLPILCYGNFTAGIDQTTLGGTFPYTFIWSNAATTEDLVNIPAGLYTITATDNNGCIAIRTFSVTEPATLSLSTVVSHVDCFGNSTGSINLTLTGGTAPYTYLWNNTVTTQDQTNLSAGIYYVTVWDNNGCSDTISATILQPTAVSVTFSNIVDATCGASDGSVCAIATGGTAPYTYTWTGGMTTSCASNIPAGNYTITVTDPNGCTATASITINSVNSTLLVDTLPIHDVSCHGGNDGSIDIVVSGGTPPYTYLWSNGTTLQDAIGLTVGYYIVTVTDANGCVSYNGGMVNEPTAITVIVSGSGTTCAGGSTGSVIISASGGTPPYLYSLNGGPTQTDSVFFGLTTGTYNIIMYDANGCTAQAADTITEVPGLTIGFANIINTTCNANNGSVCATVSSGSGNYTYIWSNTATTQCLANIAAGNYTVTVADNSACSGSATVTLTDLGSTLAVDSIITDVTCYGGTNGAICLNIIGGTPPYTYVWNTSPPQNTQCATQLSAGAYIVTVTDANGCSATSSPPVYQPTPFIVSITNIGDGSLPDTLSASLSGGIPPYNYIWAPDGATTPEAIITAMDFLYSLIVTDANGCSAYDSLLIGCPDTCVWPGDADYSGVADNNDLLAIGLGYGTTGTARFDQNITWSAHQSPNWIDYLGDTTNYKHIDCNGDGVINSDDTLAIIQNYYLQHPRSGGPDEVRGGIPSLRIRMVPDTLEDGQTVIAHLELGDANSTADNVYGLAFTFNFDPLVVDTNEVYIAFNNNSWLCNNTTDHIDIDKKDASAGKLYTALTRIDHATRSGGGEIGNVSMKITTGNINGKDLAYYAMNTYITDLRVIDNQGNVLDVDAIGDASTVQYEPTGINEINWRGEVSLYPNPAQQQLTINSSQLPISNLQVNNLLGETVLEQQGHNSGKAVLNVADLADGVYILKIASGSSTYHTKFMVNK